MNRQSVPNAIAAFRGKPRNGGSNPRFYEFDDGTIKLVKWHPSTHGPKACYNEIVASRLAQLIDAPMLRGGVVFVADEIIPDDHKSFAAEGFHFGITKMRGENFVPDRDYRNIGNLTELATAVVLLHWLRIGDQQGHNQFLERVISEDEWSLKEIGQRFRIVDAGFMFESANWDMASLTVPPSPYVAPDHLMQQVSDSDLRDAVDTLASVDDADIRACFHSVPSEWNIPKEDSSAGAEHAIHMKDWLPTIDLSRSR